ncbi:MAG: hypothetical protein MUP16_07955 [Sedimentisphaerales bacterium]|nr:hypothetical protein [Sedimentisphaerales bacterium]
MQNKANLQKDRMNANLYEKKDCEKGSRAGHRENKANPSTWFDSFEDAQDRFAHHRSLSASPVLVEGTGLSTRLPSGLSLRVEDKTGQSQFPIILVSLNWLCIIWFYVIVT